LKKRTKANPPAGLVEIYQAARGVEIRGMQKAPGHPCDAACKRAGHRYQHRFSVPVGFAGADKAGWYFLEEGDIVGRRGGKKR